jgi:bacillithiol system protein YtxJ
MQELLNLDDLQDCLIASEQRPVFIFKHSTRCPISTMAAEEVGAYLKAAPEDDPAIYMVKVLESRPVSNSVAEKLNIEHKSPQLILVHDHEAVWSTSHFNITAKKIGEGVEKARELSRQQT